ncbi:MAG: hypothetical protein ACXVCV_00675 [Polyangia bacterium]
MLTTAASGCLGSALTGGDGGNGGNGGGGSGGAADMAPDVVGKFYSDVEPILTPACGGCHSVTGTTAPAFMVAQPDMLQNLLAYPGIIGSSPEKSRLYMKGLHEGPAFTPDQKTTLGDWITFFNANRAVGDGGDAKPSISPFTPSMTAVNTIDLAPLDATIAGVKVTFSAKMVGTSIELTNIKVVAPAATGVHVVHPVFVIWDQNLVPTPDPVDSFSNLDETVFSGQTSALGPGTLLMPNFAAGDLLSVAFSVAEAKAGAADGGTTAGCKALAMFVANVKPLLASNTCSTTCHIGASPVAGLKWDATPDATLCQNALTEINTTTPAMSQLLLQPDPAQAGNGHPLKVNPFTTFQTTVTAWINAEK